MKLRSAVGVFLVIGAGLILGASPRRPMKQFLNPEGLHKPNGYTHVVSSPQGRLVFVSGQGGNSPDGQMPADFAAQARNTFENIGRCLSAAGAKFEDIVKINYYLTDLANTAELHSTQTIWPYYDKKWRDTGSQGSLSSIMMAARVTPVRFFSTMMRRCA